MQVRKILTGGKMAVEIKLNAPDAYLEAMKDQRLWSTTETLYYKGFKLVITSDDPLIAELVEENGVDWLVENQSIPVFTYTMEYTMVNEYYVGFSHKPTRVYAWVGKVKFVGGNNDTLIEALLDANYVANGGKIEVTK